MLKERQGLNLDNGETTIITVQEILEEYEINGLSLEDLQEKYVNDMDVCYEKIGEMNDKYEELNSNIDGLSEKISELTYMIETNMDSNINTYEDNDVDYTIFFVIIIIAVIVSFLIGKRFK